WTRTVRRRRSSPLCSSSTASGRVSGPRPCWHATSAWRRAVASSTRVTDHMATGIAGTGVGRRLARYSGLGLLRRAVSHADWPRAWRRHDLRRSYDVVVIGAGVHGLATAYYLAANHGITNVAVLDKGYVGGGGSGRNTAIVRSNYLTPEGVRFYDRS